MAKQTVQANETMMSSFQLAANFIALSIVPSKQSTRYVTTAQTDRTFSGCGSKGKGGKGSGRGPNHGHGGTGRQNRGGQGSHGGGGRSKNIAKTGYYTYEEWTALSHEQRDSILEARGTKSSISKVETEAEPEPGQTNNPDGGGTPTTTRGAGDEFGRKRGKHYVGMMYSSPRQACNMDEVNHIIAKAASSQQGIEIGKYFDLESHADTSVIGANCRVISYTDKLCQVAPYHPNYATMQNIPIIQAGTAYDDPNTGETIILVINQGLYFGDSLPNSLINPNQMRANGLEVDDVPKHLLRDPSQSMHSIYIPDHDIRLPLAMCGVISYLPICKPTIQEMESCKWVNLTTEAEWDPHSREFEENEKQAHENEQIVTDPIDWNIYAIQSLPFVQNVMVLEALPASLMSVNELLPQAIRSVVIQNVKSTQHRMKVSQEDLSFKWKIGLETSARTLKATTQLTIRNAIHPIQWRFCTEVAQLHYPHLGGRFGRFSSDTMFSN